MQELGILKLFAEKQEEDERCKEIFERTPEEETKRRKERKKKEAEKPKGKYDDMTQRDRVGLLMEKVDSLENRIADMDETLNLIVRVIYMDWRLPVRLNP